MKQYREAFNQLIYTNNGVRIESASLFSFGFSSPKKKIGQ